MESIILSKKKKKVILFFLILLCVLQISLPSKCGLSLNKTMSRFTSQNLSKKNYSQLHKKCTPTLIGVKFALVFIYEKQGQGMFLIFKP